MKTFFRHLFTILILLAITGCSENFFFTEEDNDIEISSIENGTILVRGAAQIPATLVRNSADTDIGTLRIELADSAGIVIASEELEGEEIGETLPAVSLEEFPSGLYEIRYTALSSTQEVLKELSVQFFLVDEETNITGLSVYPPIFYPSGSGILVASVDVPEGIDPFLRWSMGDTLVAEGLLSEGFGEIIWNTPDKEGVYTIKVELFPYDPVDFGTFNFSSSESMQADLFVSSKQKLTKNEFIPEDDYYSLFHFCGELNDTGYRKTKGQVSVTGDPVLSVEDDLFGYLVGGGNGFSIAEPLLPSDPLTGELLPFTIRLRMKGMEGMEAAGTGTLFSVVADTGDSFLALSQVNTTQLRLELRGGTESVISTLQTPFSGSVFSLSVIPQENSVSFFWYSDGENLQSETHEINGTILSPSAGTSVIGGDGDIVWLVDEFGIYARQTDLGTDYYTDIFKNEMEKEYAADLVVAEGFDGGTVPEIIVLEGSCLIDRSSLVITDPGALMVSFPLPGETIRYSLQLLKTVGTGNMVIRGRETEYLVIPLSTGDYPETVEFSLAVEFPDLLIDFGSRQYPVSLREGEEELFVEIRAEAETEGMTIGDVLVYALDNRLASGARISSVVPTEKKVTGFSN